MAVPRCPECRSADVELREPGPLWNSFLCNSCKYPFKRRAKATRFMTAVAVFIGLKDEIIRTVGDLFDGAKRLFSDRSSSPGAEASAPLPPRPPPRPRPTPPVHPKRHSASPNRLNSHKAVSLNDRGVAYCLKGELDRGIAYLSDAIELEPDYVEALNNRGYAYNLKGKYTLALNDLNHAIELVPSNATVFYNRADVYFIQGQYPLSVGDLDQAIKLNPKFADAFELRRHAKGMVGDLEGCLSDAASAERVGSRGHNAFLPGPDAIVNRIAQIRLISASFTDSSTIQVDWTTDIWTIGFVVCGSATHFALKRFPIFTDIAGGYGTNHSTVLTVPSAMRPVHMSVVVKTIGGIFSHLQPSPVSATLPVLQSPRLQSFAAATIRTRRFWDLSGSQRTH